MQTVNNEALISLAHKKYVNYLAWFTVIEYNLLLLSFFLALFFSRLRSIHFSLHLAITTTFQRFKTKQILMAHISMKSYIKIYRIGKWCGNMFICNDRCNQLPSHAVFMCSFARWCPINWPIKFETDTHIKCSINSETECCKSWLFVRTCVHNCKMKSVSAINERCPAQRSSSHWFNRFRYALNQISIVIVRLEISSRAQFCGCNQMRWVRSNACKLDFTLFVSARNRMSQCNTRKLFVSMRFTHESFWWCRNAPVDRSRVLIIQFVSHSHLQNIDGLY